MNVITQTYGALLFGSFVAMFLSGMTTVQTIIYFRLFPKDPVTFKSLVSTIWLLDIAHTVFISGMMWTYFIMHQIPKIDEIQMPGLILGTIVVTAIVTFIVHMFYLQRIFCFTEITGLVHQLGKLLLSLACVGASLKICVDMYHVKRFSAFEARRSEWVSLGLSSTAATDVAITVAMFIVLKSGYHQPTGFNNVIDQLILYTLETGSVTAVAAVACMITWFTQQYTLAPVALYLCVAKLHAMSLMGSVIIARHLLEEKNRSRNTQPWRANQIIRVFNKNKSSEFPLQEVHIDVTKSVQYDDDASWRF